MVALLDSRVENVPILLCPSLPCTFPSDRLPDHRRASLDHNSQNRRRYACHLGQHVHSRHENRHDKNRFPTAPAVILEHPAASVLPGLVDRPNPLGDGAEVVGSIAAVLPADVLDRVQSAVVDSENISRMGIMKPT